MDPLVPKDWEHRRLFLIEASKALATAVRVLNHFDCAPRNADDLDFDGFAKAMELLCRHHRRDSSGVEDLRTTIALFDKYQDAIPDRRPIADEEFRRGSESAQRLRQWLRKTFPEAGPNPKKN